MPETKSLSCLVRAYRGALQEQKPTRKSTRLVENFGGAVAKAHHDHITTGLEAMDGGADGIDPDGAEREFAVRAGLEGPAALEAEVPPLR